MRMIPLEGGQKKGIYTIKTGDLPSGSYVLHVAGEESRFDIE
ncbi:hypothetical protein ACWKWU_13030 [Chitinophaga lutea]